MNRRRRKRKKQTPNQNKIKKRSLFYFKKVYTREDIDEQNIFIYLVEIINEFTYKNGQIKFKILIIILFYFIFYL